MRRLAALAIGFLPLLACTGILGSFDVGASNDSGPTVDTGIPDTSSPIVEAGPDGALICPKNTGDCDNDPSTGCETSLLLPDSCGACGRKCGGQASCNQGVCSTEVLVSDADHPFGIALASTRLLWLARDAVHGCTSDACGSTNTVMVDVETATNNPAPTAAFSPRQLWVDNDKFYYVKCPSGTPNSDCAPAECLVTGCKSGGNQNGSTYLDTSSGNRRATIMGGGPGAVYTWQGLDALQKFTIPAPSTKSFPGYNVQDHFGGIYVDTTSFVYLDDDPSIANPKGGIFVCPIAGCATRPNSLLAPPLKHLSVAKGIAFTASNNSPAAQNILSCAIAGCNGSPTVLAQNQAYVSDIVADDKDVFWTTVGAADATTNAAAVGTVMRCSLPACAGGPEKIAEQVINPVGLAINADYVYFLTHGTGLNKNGTVVRRRR